MKGAVTVNVSIDVPDLASGLRFYGRIFGFTETARPFPSMAILDAGNITLCMHEKPAGTKPTPATAPARSYDRHWTPVHLDMHVAALDPIVALIREEGGRIEREFRSEGPRSVAFCSDPFGHGFCVIAATADEAQSGE